MFSTTVMLAIVIGFVAIVGVLAGAYLQHIMHCATIASRAMVELRMQAYTAVYVALIPFLNAPVTIEEITSDEERTKGEGHRWRVVMHDTSVADWDQALIELQAAVFQADFVAGKALRSQFADLQRLCGEAVVLLRTRQRETIVSSYPAIGQLKRMGLPGLLRDMRLDICEPAAR